MGRHQRGRVAEGSEGHSPRLRLDDLNDTSDHPPLRLSEAVKASIGRRKRELQADEASKSWWKTESSAPNSQALVT